MRMKRIIFSLSLLLFMAGIYGQTGHITLEECQQKTQDNYPLVRQYDLVEKTKEYNLENAVRGYLPQFALSAKASYQSDVTELPITIPGVDIKGMAKDQYQVDAGVTATDMGWRRNPDAEEKGYSGSGDRQGKVERRYVCVEWPCE